MDWLNETIFIIITGKNSNYPSMRANRSATPNGERWKIKFEFGYSCNGWNNTFTLRKELNLNEFNGFAESATVSATVVIRVQR